MACACLGTRQDTFQLIYFVVRGSSLYSIKQQKEKSTNINPSKLSKKSDKNATFKRLLKINNHAMNKSYYTNDLGIVYGPYGFIGFVGKAEFSCKVSRTVRYHIRKFWRVAKKAAISLMA